MTETRLSVQSVRFRGPLPPPDLLRRYDEAVPGVGKRIIAMAEQEQRNLASVSEGVAKSLLRGHSVDWLCLFAALGVVAFTAYLGQPVVATILGGATLTGLVAVFVAGRPGGAPEAQRSDSEPPEC